MKKIQRLFLPICLAVSAALFAFDAGANLDTAAYSTITDLKFGSQTRASPWFSASFGEKTRLTVNGQGTVYLLYDTSTDKISYILDLDLLQFRQRFSVNRLQLQYAVGRIFEQDFTGLVLNQSLDGLRFSVAHSIGSFSLTAGYTGLLNAHTQDMVVSADDARVLPSSDIPYALAVPKMVVKIAAQFPELVAGSDFYADFITEIDCRPLADSGYTESVNMQYVTAGFSGPIIRNLFYSIFVTAEAIQTTPKTGAVKADFAALFSGGLDYIFPAINLWLFGKLQYALFDFKPVTNLVPSFLFSNMYNNMFMATLGVSKKFLPYLSGDLSVRAYVQTQETLNAYAGLQQIEGALGLTVTILEDAQFRLDGLLAHDSAGFKYYLRGKFSLFL